MTCSAHFIHTSTVSLRLFSDRKNGAYHIDIYCTSCYSYHMFPFIYAYSIQDKYAFTKKKYMKALQTLSVGTIFLFGICASLYQIKENM